MPQSSAALKEMGLVDTGVVVGEDIVQLHRSFAQSVANYSCRKVGGDRSHAEPRPFMNSSSDVKVTDLMIYEDSNMCSDMQPHFMQFSSVRFSSCSLNAKLNFVSVVFLTENYVEMSYSSAIIFHNVWF
jgi:hypothetical protein